MPRKPELFFAFLFVLFASTMLPAEAQNFGRNKVLYHHFDFRVERSAHFDLYHYLHDNKIRTALLQDAE